MSILAYIESQEGKIKKNAFEIVSYASELSKNVNSDFFVLTINVDDNAILSKYGAKKVINISSDKLDTFNSKIYSNVISQVAKSIKAQYVIVSSSADSKYMSPLLSIDLNAGYLSNVVELPISLDPFIVKRTCYTNKAFCESEVSSEVKLIGLSSNSFGIVENPSDISVEEVDVEILDNKIKVKSTEKVSGKISIADADVVISGGRGLKGPENWNLIEDLAFLNEELLKKPFVGVDTEFRRTTKDNMRLALLQINDGEEIFLIDTLLIDSPEHQVSFLFDNDVTKIFHSCKEDLEAIYAWTNKVMTNLFDTQLANAFLDSEYSISYQGLVEKKLDIVLDKKETRSNWLRRPLSDAQLKYAALDVEYLIHLYKIQKNELSKSCKLENKCKVYNNLCGSEIDEVLKSALSRDKKRMTHQKSIIPQISIKNIIENKK